MDKNKFISQLKNKKPIPKWIFISKTILFWLLFIMFIVVGIISTSLIIYSVLNVGFDVEKTNISSNIKILLKSLPYIWILITIGFFVASYFNFKNIEKGYKYLTTKNIIITFIISVIFGIFFYNIGFANMLDTKLQTISPIYKDYMTQHMQIMWNNPDEGLLIGKIKEIKSNNEIILEDYNGIKWSILINENTIIRGRANININNGIKIIGEKINNNIFKAIEIRPEMGMMKNVK